MPYEPEDFVDRTPLFCLMYVKVMYVDHPYKLERLSGRSHTRNGKGVYPASPFSGVLCNDCTNVAYHDRVLSSHILTNIK